MRKPTTILLVFALGLCLGGQGFAQMMRERVAENIERAQDALSEGETDTALEVIVRLASYDLNPFERAAVMQNKGYVHVQRDEALSAVEAFEEAVGLEKLPEAMNINMIYMMSQLYANLEIWDKALEKLELWLPTQETVNSASYQLGAQASAELKDLDKAIYYTKLAINAEPDPPENLFRLWMALHYQKGELNEAAEVLEKTIVLFDKEEYWRNLGMIYLALKDDKRAASVNYISYFRGFMKEADDILNLVRLLLFTEQPFKAGEVLQDALENNFVPNTSDNWELLGSAWWSCRELDRSLAALNEAANLSPKSELDMRVAQIYIDKELWDDAVEHLLSAESKGVKNPGMMYQLLGYAYYGLEQFEAARLAFAKAGEASEDLEESVAMWMNHLDDEINRQKSLRALEEGAREVIIEEIPET